MRPSAWRAPLLFALAVLALAAFYDAAKLHGGYEIRYHGVRYVPIQELAFLLWYAVWGGLAAVLLAAAVRTSLGVQLVRLFARCVARPRECVFGAALFVFAYALAFRHAVLLDEPIADDELVYQLSARNLVLGKLTGPPPLDPDFLHNQFVI
ncbi:MAG TPA: hypothetical protein VG963_21475, partial [Polyangiaceae bacterium]|nr:hypothetical protein [Polyangiaceae bacterium]